MAKSPKAKKSKESAKPRAVATSAKSKVSAQPRAAASTAKKPTVSAKPRAAASSAPKWSALTAKQQRRIAARMLKTYAGLVRFGAGRYNIVGSAKHRRLRERPTVETGGEDDALTAALRNQFINLSRNAVRNNETLNAILEQFKLNAIGVEGGKAFFDFPEKYKAGADHLRREFAKFCTGCEFFDDMSWNELLKIILQTVLICGECAIVFDDGTIEDSGRVLVFEPDSILNGPKEWFEHRFPNHTQCKGKIRTKSGVIVGFIASSSERGKEEADDPARLLLFTKQPHQNPLDVPWMIVGPKWRSNQGSATPPVAAPLESLLDTADLLGFEKEAAKHNSQMYAQLIQTSPDSSDADAVYADPSATAGMEDDAAADPDSELAQAVIDETPIEPETVSFDELDYCGAFYDIMPENAKLELLDTKHPNPNMHEFIRMVECRGGWSLGLCACYVTGKVESSYTGFRGEQMMSWPVFVKWQKFCERICDWLFRAWWRYYVEDTRAVRFAPGELPDHFEDYIKWFWPRMKEVNPVDMQNAYNAGLRNGTMGVDEIIGPDWRQKLIERAEQKKFYERLGLLHPASETVSGQLVEDVKNQNEKKEGKEDAQ